MNRAMRFTSEFSSRISSACKLAAVLVAITAGLTAGPKPALGQYDAPAGNSHPQTERVTGDLASPFGPTGDRATMNSQQKLEFAAAVDLRPLKDLAVYHNGRIKILDSLARETVSGLVGRKDFQDLLSAGETDKLKKVGYDPMFTFIDLAIDPVFYADKPLIHVYFLPLREKLLDAAIPGNGGQAEAERERWKKIGRLQPVWIARHLRSVLDNMPLDGAAGRSANDVNQAMQDYLAAGKMWTVVPEADATKAWRHLSQLDAKTNPELAKAVADFGAAWRKGDAAAVNAAIGVMAAKLPALSSDAYPPVRRSVERAYNAANPFEFGYWFYALSLVSLLLAFGTQRPWLKWFGIACLSVAVGMHAFGFIARCYIAERFAIQNQFESMTGVSLFAAIVGVTLALWKRQLLFAAATAAAGFMILIVATQTGIPGREINREAAILNTSVLLKYHVSIVLFSYGLITLGFIVSVFYLTVHYLSAAKRREALAAEQGGVVAMSGGGAVLSAGGPGGSQVDAFATAAAGALGMKEGNAASSKLLVDMDKAQITMMQMAFWTLGVGIILGAWWADHSWGRWWAFDPKELWALLTWIVYLIVVHVRVAGVREKGLVTAWLSVVGFLVMLFCYFGVNLLLPGLHAYA